jgi:hypothetical protein
MENQEKTIITKAESKSLTRGDILMWLVRYGIGLIMILGGAVVLLVAPSGNGAEGFAMAVGGGLSVLLLNFLYRLGVSGDEERERHEQAWQYFVEHGEWPDDEPGGRRWTVAPGTVMYKDEDGERKRAPADGRQEAGR